MTYKRLNRIFLGIILILACVLIVTLARAEYSTPNSVIGINIGDAFLYISGDTVVSLPDGNVVMSIPVEDGLYETSYPVEDCLYYVHEASK